MIRHARPNRRSPGTKGTPQPENDLPAERIPTRRRRNRPSTPTARESLRRKEGPLDPLMPHVYPILTRQTVDTPLPRDLRTIRPELPRAQDENAIRPAHDATRASSHNTPGAGLNDRTSQMHGSSINSASRVAQAVAAGTHRVILRSAGAPLDAQ